MPLDNAQEIMDPEQVDRVLDEANRLLEAGEPEESLRCLESLPDDLADPEHRVECATLRAYALSELGRQEQALQELQPMLEEHPDSPRLLGVLGVVLSGMDDLEPARVALETAVSLDGQDETLVANLALVYEKLHDYRAAIRLYDRAIRLGADLDWALQRKAAALAEAGDCDAAKITLKRYLSLVPDDADQWVALGILHSDAEEYEQAYACYRQAEQIDPSSGILRLNWGVTAVRGGDLEQARRQLAQLERLEPDSSRSFLLRAFVFEEEGDLRGTQRCYRAALARLDGADRGQLSYTLEMAMDFYARRGMRRECERLLARAYRADACTVELCEPYRELTGRRLPQGYWFNVIVEADYPSPSADGDRPCALRGQRSIQVIARDRDEAARMVLEFARRMGETHLSIREFASEEPLEDVHLGIYEVQKRRPAVEWF